MNELEFIIALLDKLAWPLTLMTIFLLFRKPIVSMFHTFKNVEITSNGLKIEFSQEISKLKETTKEAFAADDQDDDNSIKLYSLASSKPKQAILESWKYVEAEADKLIKKFNPDITFDESSPYKQMEGMLRDQNLIEANKVRIFNDLRLLRNKVAHWKKYEIDSQQAIEYVDIALKLAKYLKSRLSGDKKPREFRRSKSGIC